MDNTHRKKGQKSLEIKVKRFLMPPQFGTRFAQYGKSSRKKVNFMVNVDLIEAMKFYLGEGERSNFLNTLLEEGLKDLAHRKASQDIDDMRKEMKWKMTDEEIRKAREYGRM